MSNDMGHHETHNTPIKTPRQLIIVVILAFMVLMVLLIMLANLVTFTSRESSGSDAMTVEATARRIAPVAGYEFVDANAPKVFQTGEQIYKQVCTACHAAGVAGALKFGDKAAWAPYIATGEDAMLKSVLNGKGAMPPKGGAMNASEDDLRAAVRYIMNAAH